MVEARNRKSLEALRIWAHQPTRLQPEDAARNVRRHLPPQRGRRSGIGWQWLAAGFVGLCLATALWFASPPQTLKTAWHRPDGSEAAAESAWHSDGSDIEEPSESAWHRGGRAAGQSDPNEASHSVSLSDDAPLIFVALRSGTTLYMAPSGKGVPLEAHLP